MSYDLRGLVKQVLDTVPASDPAIIAGEVLRLIPADKFQDALIITLPNYVRVAIHEQRADSSAKLRQARANASQLVGSGAGGRGSVPRFLSAKIADVWQAMQAIRDERIQGLNGWVRRGAATVDDLLFAATYRETQAAKNAAVAAELRSQAAAIQAAGVRCLQDMSDADQARVFGLAA